MKRITVVNCSLDVVNCRAEKCGVEGDSDGAKLVFPGASMTLELPSFRVGLVLTPQSVTEKSSSVDEKWSVAPTGFSVRGPLALGAMWKEVPVPGQCPWIMYRIKVSRKHHRILVLPRRDTSCFLKHIPDTVPLSCVTLPGTHDTMAFYGWPVSQCQSLHTPLAVQLASGIRVLDIRLAVKDKRLMAYHGLYPQKASFQDILAVIHAFLTAEKTKRETVVMSIKQEDFATVRSEHFSQLVHDEIASGPGGRAMWYLDNRVPALGEVRGKVVMFSRFGGDGDGWEGGLEGLGIHPTTWPDSAREGFSWECKNTVVRTHDWYSIPSFLYIPEKTALATQILLPPPGDPPTPSLAITFFSASSFPLAFPPTVARGFGWPKLGFGVEGVNSRAAQWFMKMLAEGAGESKEPRIRGWALMDFYDDPEKALVPLLIECNFRGRVRGEEGWM